MASELRLSKSEHFPAAPGPVLVVVMDGMGIGPEDAADAVYLARTPTLDRLRETCPHVSLRAHGTAVGLPSDKDMGNSEVGHNALGAGRVFDQGAKLVNRAIEDGSVFAGAVWQALLERCRQGGAIHFVGLLSDGNVHSHIDQLFALLRRARADGARRIFVHPLLDGRDVPETSALSYVDRLEALLEELADPPEVVCRIASGGGRMLVTMDRYEANWGVVERGWNAHVHGQGRPFRSAREAIEAYRAEQPGIIDQFLPEFVVVDEAGEPVGRIRDGDAVVFFNFRGDRAIEISRAFEQETFSAFDRGVRPDVLYAGMMQYDGDLLIPKRFLVSPPAIEHTSGELLAATGVTQFACAETQKFGHVTYFWNGNRSGRFSEELETYVEVPSDQVPFEQRPWMKAAEVTDETIRALEAGAYRFLRINYANGDMVGHTGNLDAAILAVEAVDISLGRLLDALARERGVALVTADHGNADDMAERDKKTRAILRDEAGRMRPKTSHTLNPVPLYLADFSERSVRLDLQALPEAGLANVAATFLELLGFQPPPDYAPSLLARPGK